MKLEVVFHFSSGGTHVLETKRLGLPPSAQPDEIYQWFLIDSEQVKPLTFISMKLNPQTRIFEEEY